MTTETQLYYTELNKLQDLARVAIYSNPDLRMHVLYKYRDLVYIYYSNAREVLFARVDQGLKAGLYEWYMAEELLNPVPNDFDLRNTNLLQVFIFIVEVIRTNLITDIISEKRYD